MTEAPEMHYLAVTATIPRTVRRRNDPKRAAYLLAGTGGWVYEITYWEHRNEDGVEWLPSSRLYARREPPATS